VCEREKKSRSEKDRMRLKKKKQHCGTTEGSAAEAHASTQIKKTRRSPGRMDDEEGGGKWVRIA